MPTLAPELDTRSDAFAANRAHTLALIDEWRAIEAATRTASAKAGPLFERRGQLLPRERVARLLDPGVPFFELSTLAGFGQDGERGIAGGGAIIGIGVVEGVRVLVVADDAGIDAGALQAQGLEKLLRAQQIALDNKLPFVHLIESAGANLLRYRVEQFVRGGALFCNLARPRTMITWSHSPVMYAPPAVDEPCTTPITGSPAADSRARLQKRAPPRTNCSTRYLSRFAPADSIR